MGKSIRSNSKKAFRSQRRALIDDEPVMRNAEAARSAALAQVLAAPRKEGLTAVDPGPGPSKLASLAGMDVDQADEGARSRSRSRGRSQHRSVHGTAAPAVALAASDQDVDMEMSAAEIARSVRGPNQYKKQGRLKVGAKARLGASGKTVKLGSKRGKKAKVHGVASGARKPRFSNSSKRK